MNAHPPQRAAARIIAGIAVADILVLWAAGSKAVPVGWAVGSVGVLTFLGLLIVAHTLSGGAPDRASMREPIAGALIVVYVATVSMLTFYEAESRQTTLEPTIVQHFTYLVGIVVAFYFGSTAVEKYAATLKERDRADDRKTDADE